MTQQEVQDIVNYFDSIRNSGRIWIEAEMPNDSKNSFDTKYQKLTGATVPTNSSSYPYYVWEPGANKWGIELRVYFSSDDSIPDCLQNIVTDNSRGGYEEYDARANSNEVIWKLFANGFVLGEN
jgi:hypothetical protein